jgi:uncharacterized protein
MSEKEKKLERYLRTLDSALIALSGGTDSMLLSSITQSLLGEHCFSVTVVSEFFIPGEKFFIESFVKQQRIRHEYLRMSVLGNSEVRKNPRNRCYLCKQLIFGALVEYARQRGFSALCDGTNTDDLLEDRPGLRALEDLHIISPYVEAGMGKKDIQELARARGLEKYIRPSNTCLATRISEHSNITEEKLRMVADAEEFMKKLGFPVVRVRFHEPFTARIEVSSGSLGALWKEDVLTRLHDAFRQIGFQRTAIDIEGYREPSHSSEEGKNTRGD